MLVRPMTIAPPRRRLATEEWSSLAIDWRKATTPSVVGWPARSTLIFVVTGIPRRGGRTALLEFAKRRSATSAAASASASKLSTTALTLALTCCIRRRQLCVASLAEMRRWRKLLAKSAAVQLHSGPSVPTAPPEIAGPARTPWVVVGAALAMAEEPRATLEMKRRRSIRVPWLATTTILGTSSQQIYQKPTPWSQSCVSPSASDDSRAAEIAA